MCGRTNLRASITRTSCVCLWDTALDPSDSEHLPQAFSSAGSER